MKTERIKIEKFKAVENLEQQIGGKNILLIGDNGVGKSSVIQFIEIALGKQSNVPPNAEGKGEIVFTKNGQEVTVKLDFRDGKPYIKVSGKGISIDNKKSAIADLFGAIDFDIDEFVDLSKTKAGRKEQVEIFKKFLPLEVQSDLKTFENNVQNHFNDRAEVNKEIKRYEALVSANEMNSLLDTELVKFTESDSAALMAELKKTQVDNEKVDKVIDGIEKRNEAVANFDLQIEELENRILKIKAEKEGALKEIADGAKWLKVNQKQPTDAIEEQIKNASENNTKHSKAQQLIKDRKTLLELRENSGELTALIDSSREAIANAIREQDSPVDGLTYDDDQLIYNDLPVSPDTLSTGEIMELGIRLKMAENPELGMLFIQRGESLGQERLNRILELSKKYDWQLIMEQVERGKDKLTIEIFGEETH